MAAAEGSSRYSSYKAATRACVWWLGTVAPPRPQSVAEILACAQQCVRLLAVVPRHVLLDLDTSIRLREEVQSLLRSRAAVTSESDASHGHFISALSDAHPTRSWGSTTQKLLEKLPSKITGSLDKTSLIRFR